MQPSSLPAIPDVVTRVPRSNPHVLSEPASLLLDIIRLSAALVVLYGHLTVGVFHTGLRDVHYIGEWAVPVFFVLSGFIIRFVTRSREHTATAYFIDRASRMYSVVLPAMALTLVIAGLCILLNPAQYAVNWGPYSNQPLLRVLLNITFLSQLWGMNTIPLIDGPFWSLGYECLYYVAYGFLFFYRGPRRTLTVAVLALISGPALIFLFPIWWLGCWLYDLYHSWRTRREIVLGARLLVAAYLLPGCALLAAGRSAFLMAPFSAIAWFGALPNPLDAIHINSIRASNVAFAIGIASGVAMLVLLLAIEGMPISAKSRGARWFRRCADGTFTIYLMHYPLLALGTFLPVFKLNDQARNIGYAVGIAVVLTLIAAPLDRLKSWMRHTLNRRFQPHVTKRKRSPAAA